MRFPYDQEYYPPAPSVEVRLGAPDSALTVGPLLAFVDTGADASIVPFRHIEPLGVPLDDRKFLRSPWGERRSVDSYLLDVGIGEIRLPLIEIIADDVVDEVILGRNVLNKLIITLDGPRGTLEVVD